MPDFQLPLPQVSLVAVGDELLNGKISDTNSSHIARTLKPLGISVKSIRLVGDCIEDIIQTLQLATRESQYVICTGGLGPTSDDRTREAIAAVAGSTLTQNADSLARITEYCQRRNRTLNANNLQQVYFPATARVVENTKGTADAFETPITDPSGALYSHILALPGVPSEMRALVEGYLVPRVCDLFPNRFAPIATSFRIFGIAESMLGELIDNLALSTSVVVSYRPQFPEILLELAALDESGAMLLAEAAQRVRSAIGPAALLTEVATLGLPEIVAQLLRHAGKTVACAESCSGGLLADAFVSLPGSSSYFSNSVVAYSKLAKQRLLGIPASLLAKHGTVSEEVALAMAGAVREQSDADFGLSITGVAGPEGGTEATPVGTIWVAIASAEGAHAHRLSLPWDRGMVRRFSTYFALSLLRAELLGVSIERKLA